MTMNSPAHSNNQPIASGTTAAPAPSIRVFKPDADSNGGATSGGSSTKELMRLRGPGSGGPGQRPPSSGKAVEAPSFDSRDTLWIQDDLGNPVGPLTNDWVKCYAVVGETPSQTPAIPDTAQLVVARGPLRHEAGVILTIKSATLQTTLFVGALRYPIDLDGGGTVLLLLAEPGEHNAGINGAQIYTARFVSPAAGQQLSEHTRHELPLGTELLPPAR